MRILSIFWSALSVHGKPASNDIPMTLQLNLWMSGKESQLFFLLLPAVQMQGHRWFKQLAMVFLFLNHKAWHSKLLHVSYWHRSRSTSAWKKQTSFSLGLPLSISASDPFPDRQKWAIQSKASAPKWQEPILPNVIVQCTHIDNFMQCLGTIRCYSSAFI